MRDFYLFHEMSVAEAIVRRLWRWAVPLLLSLLLAGIALQNYLLFHTLVELFTIVVAVSAAVIVWNTYPFTRNGFLLYLGLGHLGLAWLTLLHTLSYKGMGLFEIGDANLPTQFWVAIRFSECLLWLSAPLFLGHGARPRQGLLLFGLWVLILNGLIYTGIFPDAFLEASGLTAFKKISEIAVIGLLALAAGFLLGNRARLDPAMLSLLLGSLGLSALAGVAFMLYRDVYGIANMVGHLLRLCAYGLIYQALVEFVVKRPFQNLAQGASTYDAVPDAIVLVDRLGLIRDANQAARQLFRGGDGIGNAVHALLHPSIQGPCAVCDAIRAGESLSAFAFAHPVQGVYFEISLSPIRRADEAVAMIQISRDITGRRRADALLETSRSRLEASHHRLEATVSELQLMATRAESANIAKSEFLANMSHEIRTPLNGVIGMNELLLNSPLSPEQRRYAEVVSTSGRALLGLINDILDFSRIEARRLDFENVSFDLAELIEQTVSILAVPAHDKGLSLITCLDPAVPARVCGDPARLRQVLTNLLGNSVKFTPAGEVRLSVACEQADPAQVRLHFAVRDTGIGIAAGQIEKIFKPFTQADGSTTRKYGGTGLGLSIAYQLVEMMGGELHCLSQPGSGSEFWFSIRFDRPLA
ncbi:MAG: hypothetical protein CVV27_03895, partial [Candidatus Melainabacteria bacterium HGW-Melainabacteria-1]